MIKIKKPFFCVYLVLLTLGSPLAAEVVASFRATDGADPRQQGWAAFQTGSDVRGSATTDAGKVALRIDDRNHADGALIFRRTFNEKSQQLADVYGWRLTAIFRVDECDVPDNNSKLEESTAQIVVYGGSGGRGMQLNFSLTDKSYGADGYGLVMGVDGSEIHHNIPPGDGYVTVVADARRTSKGRYAIEVSVNGHPRLSQDDARMDGGKLGGVEWGSFGSDGVSSIYWRSVVLETVENTPTRAVVDAQRMNAPEDFSPLERYLGAKFTVDAPQPVSNLPMGKCAEFKQRGTAIAVTKPTVYASKNHINIDYAIRNPATYDSREDFRLYLTYYREDRSGISLALHHRWLKENGLPYQWKTDKERPEAMADILAQMHQAWSEKLNKGKASRYQLAALDVIDTTLKTIDQKVVAQP